MQRSGREIKRNRNNSFLKGLLLLFVFAAILFLYRNLKTNGLPSHFSSMLSGEFDNYRNLKALDSTNVDSIKGQIAGFWVHTSGDSLSAVRVTDCLELQKTGIIWQVIRWDINYLNADSISLYHIRNCYLNPYSLSADSSEVLCDVRILRQSFIYGNDTCYGASQIDKMWRGRWLDGTLELNKKRYSHYSGPLQMFFPDSMIDLVDKINISECRESSQLTPYAIEFLKNAFAQNQSLLQPDNRRIIYDFYDSFLKDELIESLPYLSSIDDSIPIVLTIQPDGNVQNVAIQNGIVVQNKLQEQILKEAFVWKFPIRETDGSIEIRYTLKF
ncbi:MAG TPA: hypothetical protein VHO70_23245 [Chitinispirillaceae bacterium]|nr:hypothetical protein [Chitinispirillaceae bacterium]